jgi:hypothetical protein
VLAGIVSLLVGVVLAGLGLAVDFLALSLVGGELVLLAAAILVKADLTVSLGFASVKIPLADVPPPAVAEGVTIEQLYDYSGSVTVLVNRSTKQVFIEAPRFFQDAVNTTHTRELDNRRLGSLVAKSIKTAHAGASLPWVYKPGDTVPVSGIYDVVAQDGRFLGHQEALVRERVKGEYARFPVFPEDSRAGYAVRKVAVHSHPTKVHHPGDEVPDSGIYDVVGPRGDYQNQQKVCVQGHGFPPFPRHPRYDGFGYVLHERAVSRAS